MTFFFEKIFILIGTFENEKRVYYLACLYLIFFIKKEKKYYDFIRINAGNIKSLDLPK